MIALIPVSRFSVRYEVGGGRPYSELEELILKAIAASSSGTTLTDLRETFRIHDRLVIESVVTLIRAGWVALAGSDRLVPTAEGAETVRVGHRLQSTVARGARANLIMERVCGLIRSDTHHDQLNIRTRRELDAALGENLRRAVMLEVRHTRNSLDEGQVQQLLPRKPGEWIRWIGPIEMQSRDYHFVPVYVEPESGEVNGLPRAWEPLLRGIILDEARSRASEDAEFEVDDLPALLASRRKARRAPARTAVEQFRAIDVSPGDLLWDTADVRHHIIDMISRAKTTFLLVTPIVNTVMIDALEKPIAEALNRNVNVDILWGELDGDGDSRTGPVAAMRRIANTNIRESEKRMRFNRNPSHVVSGMAFADLPTGLEALIGGTGQVFSAEPDQPIVPAFCLRERGLIAEVIRAVAGWWANTPGEELSATVDRLRRIASGYDRDLAIHTHNATPQANDNENDDKQAADNENAPIYATATDAHVIVGAEYALIQAAMLDHVRDRVLLVTASPLSMAGAMLTDALTVDGECNPEIIVARPAPSGSESESGLTQGVFLLADNRCVFGCHCPFPVKGAAVSHTELSIEVRGQSTSMLWGLRSSHSLEAFPMLPGEFRS